MDYEEKQGNRTKTEEEKQGFEAGFGKEKSGKYRTTFI
jgi:hypothetical protein